MPESWPDAAIHIPSVTVTAENGERQLSLFPPNSDRRAATATATPSPGIVTPVAALTSRCVAALPAR